MQAISCIFDCMPWHELHGRRAGRSMAVSRYPGGPPEVIEPIRDVQEIHEVRPDGTRVDSVTMWVGPHPDGVTHEPPHTNWIPDGAFGPEFPIIFRQVDGRGGRDLRGEEDLARKSRPNLRR